jgi:hypothetical protein
MDRHAQRSPDCALEECGHHLWPGGELAGKAIVERGKPRRGEDVPQHVIANESLLGWRDPGLEHVALAEQLGAGAVAAARMAAEEGKPDA